MGELLGMSARHPTAVNHSLALLRPRGGEIGPHADGWGIAFYEGRAARVFKESVPASESRCLAFIADYDYRSSVVIGHIRKANPSRSARGIGRIRLPWQRCSLAHRRRTSQVLTLAAATGSAALLG